MAEVPDTRSAVHLPVISEFAANADRHSHGIELEAELVDTSAYFRRFEVVFFAQHADGQHVAKGGLAHGPRDIARALQSC
jgi:hypothetical protein